MKLAHLIQWTSKGIILSTLLFSFACDPNETLLDLEAIESEKPIQEISQADEIALDSLAENQRLVYYQMPGKEEATKIIVELDEAGNLVAEGDIILGTLEDLGAIENRGIAHLNPFRRWTNATIPYTIAASHPKRNEILAAIQQINQRTPLKVISRTNQGDYVRFVDGNVCQSSVGRVGGMQHITIGDCSLGTIMHEICHAAGLWHEQSRCDRNSHVTVHWENITAGKEHNFNRHCTDGVDLGAYDYSSIMHYSEKAFSKNGLPTISTQNGANIGASELSYGDINALVSIYPYAANSAFSGSFTGLFRKNTADDYLWIGANWASFNDKRQDLARQGYRLFDMETYVKNGKRLYDGTWEKVAGGDAFYQYSSWSSFTTKWSSLSNQGYRLVDIETFYANGKRYYSGIFHKMNGKYALYQYNSWSNFTSKWTELSNQGFRLIDIESFSSNGRQYYIGVYLSGTDAYALYNYNSWSSFLNKWKDLGKDGIHLIDFERVRVGSSYKYLGVYRKKSNGTYLWHNVNWQSFKNKWHDLGAAGYNIVDFEHH